MKYSIDTCSLLQPWHSLYPDDVFPDVWANLDKLIEHGEVVATEEVFFELEKQDDEVLAWAKRRRGMFIEIDDAIQPVVSDILERYERLVDTRRSRSGADPFVIALAKANDGTVVTEEPRTGKLDKPNIPDVCKALGVRCINFLGLIRQEGWVFRSQS